MLAIQSSYPLPQTADTDCAAAAHMRAMCMLCAHVMDMHRRHTNTRALARETHARSAHAHKHPESTHSVDIITRIKWVGISATAATVRMRLVVACLLIMARGRADVRARVSRDELVI